MSLQGAPPSKMVNVSACFSSMPYSMWNCFDLSAVPTVSPNMSATAAGGRFRSRFGRSLFRTEKVCQSVIQPDIVTNKVCCKH